MVCYICKFDNSGVKCDLCSKLFCSEGHLSLHRPGETCLPYHITELPECGRFIAAEKDIEEGELILDEECLVWGPNHVAEELCLECLTPQDLQLCSECGYPLCHLHINNNSIHQAECKILAGKGVKLSETIRENGMETAYPLIAPLRCLRLKFSNPESWRTIENFMDHREERMLDADSYIQPNKIDVIDKLSKELEFGTEEEIIQVLGYLDVNCHAVRGRDGAYRGRGIYPVGSLMNHSCICNTRNIIQGTRLRCYATTKISKGEPITTHYASPLLPLNSRREKLKSRWFFDCCCSRCSDKTDLTSGLKCEKCPDGYLLPTNPLDVNTDYRCECGGEMCSAIVSKITSSFEPMVEALKVFQLSGTSEEESLLKTLLQKFHPSHYLPLDLKLNLGRKLGRTEGALETCETSVLIKKIKFCAEALDVMNYIYPGLSKYRGLLCYDIAESQILLTSRLIHLKEQNSSNQTEQMSIEKSIIFMQASFDCDIINKQVDFIHGKSTKIKADRDVDKSQLLSNFATCLIFIQEGLKCLVLDREGCYEHEIYLKLQDLQQTCQDIITFQNFI